MEKPHQKNLRIGRVSVPGQFYTITKCCHRKMLLIPDEDDSLTAKRNFDIIARSIAWLNSQRFWICSDFVMMPDHVHLIFQLGNERKLAQVMHSFSSFTAHEINKKLSRDGPVWQDGYYDHALRDEDSYIRHVKYIAENPVRAGFVQEAMEWPFMKIGIWSS